MAEITLGGNIIHTVGSLPQRGSTAPNFTLTRVDLADISLDSYREKKVVLNIFPSIDTGVCAASVRKFNEEVSSMENTVVLCISRDLPFAQGRFCGAEGLDRVIMLSVMRDFSFGKDYGVEVTDGPMAGLLSRAVVVLDTEGTVVYTEQVPEIGQEPDYVKAVSAVKGI
jgi:thioredoxin-dependent peroxiredoxin